MMPSLSRAGWAVVCMLLLCERRAAQSEDLHCSGPGPVGAQHPVEGLLERFEASLGCAARELGTKETHVVAVGRATSSPENKVMVLLKLLSLTPSPPRVVHLLLSSKLPVTWWLEADRLPPSVPVQVQVSSNSSVQSRSLSLDVHKVPLLPFHPRALHRWALKRHGNLSSMTHATHGNRVYVRLGEDPTQPAACHLQPLFLSQNYMTSDLQPQEVQGCASLTLAAGGTEVHIIKLHSAGSSLCGLLQVEVTVSLLPPVGSAKACKVVLVLSSSVAVNWAVAARGVQGHVTVHASHSVSPPYPAEPGLTLATRLTSDLSTVPDLLLWANKSGYEEVTSYTEADLANRFVIQLSGGGTGEASLGPVAFKPTWVEERRLRQWLRGGGGRESFTVNCQDGLLSVAVDRQVLQSLSVPVASVTLRDRSCQAGSNGSHFLLVFPVIFCGTEGLLLHQPRGVQYNNTVLLWKENPENILGLNLTEKSKSPLSIRFSCFAPIPNLAESPTTADHPAINASQTELALLGPEGAEFDPVLGPLPRPRLRSGPLLLLKLFVTENYEETRIGPCVVTAGHRVYVEISVKAPLTHTVDVKSCFISPLSDPKKSPFWSVMSDGCFSDPSLTLSTKTEEEEEEAEGELVEEKEETERGERDSPLPGRRGRKKREEEEIQPLRFSFVLHPVYNDSMQFLHCSVRLCPQTQEVREETVKENECEDGRRIPPLVSGPHTHQCETRNLSRPMVVTQSISSLAQKMRNSVGQRTKRLSVAPQDRPEPENHISVLQTGPAMGIVFAAFVMGVGLMGGLWCIYNYTGPRPAARQECYLTDQTHVGRNICSLPSLSDQSSSSV